MGGSLSHEIENFVSDQWTSPGTDANPAQVLLCGT